MRAWLLICGITFLTSCGGDEVSPESEAAATDVLRVPVDLSETFVPVRWGEAETIDLDPDFGALNRPGDDDGTCVRIRYHPADEYWGAVYWQTRKELGVRKPARLPAGSRITFWAKGETGREVVEFRLPGEPSKELLTHIEPTNLSTEWKHFELEIGNRATEPGTGIFGVRWDCVANRNTGGLTFYLDDLRIEQ